MRGVDQQGFEFSKETALKSGWFGCKITTNAKRKIQNHFTKPTGNQIYIDLSEPMEHVIKVLYMLV